MSAAPTVPPFAQRMYMTEAGRLYALDAVTGLPYWCDGQPPVPVTGSPGSSSAHADIEPID